MRLSRVVAAIVLSALGAVAPTTPVSAAAVMYPIEGQVTDITTGLGVTGICVFADSASTARTVAQTRTVAAGLYRLSVPAGRYLVHFIDCPSETVYAAQWYDGANNRYNAQPVAVGALSPAVGIDAALHRGTPVSGTVTDKVTGAPIAGICVSVYSLSDSPRGGTPETSTGAAGHWKLLVPDGDYIVYFRDCHAHPTYTTQWWNDAYVLADADVLTVDGTTTLAVTGIDAAMVAR
jgi:hypothetical protein